jgi:hypothetical protein
VVREIKQAARRLTANSKRLRQVQNQSERYLAVLLVGAIRELSGVDLGPHTSELLLLVAFVVLARVPDLAEKRKGGPRIVGFIAVAQAAVMAWLAGPFQGGR